MFALRLPSLHVLWPICPKAASLWLTSLIVRFTKCWILSNILNVHCRLQWLFRTSPPRKTLFSDAMPETASGSLQFVVLCRCIAGCFVKVCFNMSRCRVAKMRTVDRAAKRWLSDHQHEVAVVDSDKGLGDVALSRKWVRNKCLALLREASVPFTSDSDINYKHEIRVRFSHYFGHERRAHSTISAVIAS